MKKERFFMPMGGVYFSPLTVMGVEFYMVLTALKQR